MCNIFESEQDTYTDSCGKVGGECMCNIFETEQDTSRREGREEERCVGGRGGREEE